jgi:hypothetical protein
MRFQIGFGGMERVRDTRELNSSDEQDRGEQYRTKSTIQFYQAALGRSIRTARQAHEMTGDKDFFPIPSTPAQAL